LTSEQTNDIRTFASSDEPSMSSVMNQSQLGPVDSQRTANQDVRTLCDLEVQQLREMFPDCPEDVLKEASERYVTIDSAIDFIMSNREQATSIY
jgi:hypothetical protein